jgi:hypothetical protein
MMFDLASLTEMSQKKASETHEAQEANALSRSVIQGRQLSGWESIGDDASDLRHGWNWIRAWIL